MLAQDNPSVFEELMRAVVWQPEFPKWARSEVMGLALSEAAEVSAVPFVELLMASEDGGQDRGGRADLQLAAAQLLVEAMPRQVEALGLETVLREHPVDAVRRWWRARQEERERGEAVVVSQPSGVELVRIPGGKFLMGSPARVGASQECPQHEVELASFSMARTPVTNHQYGVYLQANPHVRNPAYWGDRRYNQPDQPVVGVSWDEAKAYCEWAGLSLPTEAQWEYACRAGTSTQYWSGDGAADLARVGWYEGNSEGRLHGVGEKPPNPCGLYDMHGNVWEWCEDAWFGNYAGASHRSGDGLRVESEGIDRRVLRGGGFILDAGIARSAYRAWGRPGFRWRYLGFRPVLRPREVVESSG